MGSEHLRSKFKAVTPQKGVLSCGCSCMFMQSLGMIDSAINVWNGTEVVNVDPNPFESENTLLPEMTCALLLLNKEQRRILSLDKKTSSLGKFLDFYKGI